MEELLVTFGGALAFGVLLVLLALRLRTSAIVLLLLGGILLGPQGVNLIHPGALGEGLHTITQLAVGLIVFEGGLSLDLRGYRQASRAIRNILTLGVVVTWLGGAVVVRWLFDYSWPFCFLAGSLTIVTGATVMSPLLRRVRVNQRLHHILHWESVLIDPIGVFIALLCYEFMVSGGGRAFVDLDLRLLVGAGMGVAAGIVISWIIRRGWVATEYLNIFVLASAVGVFVLSDVIAHESGLLTVTIAGMVIGYLDRPEVENLRSYKAELTQMLIGLLFVLLAANLELGAFLAGGWPLFGAVLLVMFVVRPLNVFVSTLGTDVTWRERLFLGWVAPRGIIAASMASLFALQLRTNPNVAVENPEFLETFAYSVIAGTVLFQGWTAGTVGRLLGVIEPEPQGWLVIGAHTVGRRLATFIRRHDQRVVLLDRDPREVAKARRAGLAAVHADPMTIGIDDDPELFGLGNVLAITANSEQNSLLCQRWQRELPRANHYRWTHPDSPDEGAGKLVSCPRVWPSLNIDEIILREAAGQDLGLRRLTVDPAELRHPERVLLCQHEGQLTPSAPAAGSGEAEILFYYPFAPRLEVDIRSNWIVISAAGDMDSLLAELLARLRDDFPELPLGELQEQLAAREREFSSLIGYGVALPHAYTELLDNSVVVVGKLPEPLPDRHSGDDVHIVFLVLSPKDQPRRHLKALSEISRFIMNEDNRENLEAARTPQDLLRIFFPE